MKPLAVHGGVAAGIWSACAAAWALFELGLAIRVRGASGRDRSFVPLTLSVVGGMALGQFVARRAGLTLPGPGWWPVALGAVVFALGLALRAWPCTSWAGSSSSRSWCRRTTGWSTRAPTA